MTCSSPLPQQKSFRYRQVPLLDTDKVSRINDSQVRRFVESQNRRFADFQNSQGFGSILEQNLAKTLRGPKTTKVLVPKRWRLDRVRAMAETGDLVYLVCRDLERSQVRLCGWVVSETGSDVVVSVGADSCGDLDQVLKANEGSAKVAFVRVPADSQPENWKGPKPTELVSLKACGDAWKKVDQGNLSSSEADRTRPDPKPKAKGQSQFTTELANMSGLFKGSDSEEDEDDEGLFPSSRRMGTGHLAPGPRRRPHKEKASAKRTPDIGQRPVRLGHGAPGAAHHDGGPEEEAPRLFKGSDELLGAHPPTAATWTSMEARA